MLYLQAELSMNTRFFYLKYGNRIYAKFISLLFNGPKLSDVGSSFRVFKKK